MSTLWRRIAGRFDALNLRERAMVSAAVMVALLAFVYTMMLEPELIRQRRAAGAMLQKHSELRALDAQVQALAALRSQDPERPRRERLAQLKSELSEVEARILAEQRRFTAPAQMRSVVEGVLARSRGVALVEMKTLAVTTLAPKEAEAKKHEAKDRPIYRHGVELTVAGSYLDLLAYLRDLEALPTQLYWGALDLDASKHPKLLMKLTVYTLSLERAWLSV
jgi:MSHA biogenesis protein MshJ